jgi:hypothetical protein
MEVKDSVSEQFTWDLWLKKAAVRWVFHQEVWLFPTHYHSTNALYLSVIRSQYTSLTSGNKTRELILTPHYTSKKISQRVVYQYYSCLVFGQPYI